MNLGLWIAIGMSSYGTLCAEFYDLDKPDAPADALAFYVERAREAGGRILEPMCGSGRFLLPMQQAGVPVDGVDSSPAMLEACRRRAHAIGLEARVHLQEVGSLALSHTYAMAFIPSGSIGFFVDDATLRKALTSVHAHLEPDGRFFVEIVNDDDADPSTEIESRTVSCPDGCTITYTCAASRSGDGGVIRFSGRYEKRRGTTIVASESEALALRLYSAAALVSELCACGFSSPTVVGPSELPFLAASGCRLIEARR